MSDAPEQRSAVNAGKAADQHRRDEASHDEVDSDEVDDDREPDDVDDDDTPAIQPARPLIDRGTDDVKSEQDATNADT